MVRILDNKTPKAQKDLFGAFVVGTAGFQLLNFFCSFLLLVAYINLAMTKQPSLVQMTDGSAIVASQMGNQERTSAVIQRFSADIVTLLMSWTGKVAIAAKPGQPNSQADPGIEIKIPNAASKRIATTTWQASFAFSEDFRPELLRKIAELTPQEVFTGKAQVLLIIQEITLPEQIAPGQWKLAIVANLTTFAESQGEGKSIPFNKEIFVRAIDTPVPTEAASPLEGVIYDIRKSGLEIYAMRDLPRPDLTQ